jgi:hypothetical protein
VPAAHAAKARFAQRATGPRDRREHEGLARGEPIPLRESLPAIAWNLGVDERRQAQGLGPPPQRRDRPESDRPEAGPRRRRGDRLRPRVPEKGHHPAVAHQAGHVAVQIEPVHALHF